MSTSAFQSGVRFTINKTTYELTRKIENEIWQAEELKTKRVHEFSIQSLLELYASEQLKFTAIESTPNVTPQFHVHYSQQQWEIAKLRRIYVLKIIDLPSNRELVKSITQATWEKTKQPAKAPGATAVIRWKNRYLQSGKDIRSLIDRNERKGNSIPRYDAELIDFVMKAIEKKYLSLERGTIESTLDFAKILVIHENKLRPKELQLRMPSRSLVKHTIEKIDAFDSYCARHGRTAATKKFRTVLGHRTTNAPLERAEIDHTPLDLFVVDDKTRLPLGRPWLTVCIDDYTRCILGIHIGFEPPSYLTVSKCLRQAFLPKANLNADFPNIKNAWNAHGVMGQLVVDNGLEFHSNSLENACYSLGMEIHYAPRKVAWFKGKIERFQGTLNRAISHGNPGTTFSNIFEKDDYNPSKHAVISYSILKEIVNTWIVDVYHQKPHGVTKMPPAAMWQNSIAPEDILVPDDIAMLNAILGRSEQRQLTHKGIELYGLFYNSAELTSLRRKHGDKLSVEIRIDTSDLGQIIVLSPFGNEIYKASALDAAYAKNLSKWQHDVCKRFAAIELQKFTPDSWLEAKYQIAKLIDEEFMHKKQKTRTKVARYKGDALANKKEMATTTTSIEHTPAPITLNQSNESLLEPLPADTQLEVPTKKKRFIFQHRDRSPESIHNELNEDSTND